jgi:hypothetical protein
MLFSVIKTKDKIPPQYTNGNVFGNIHCYNEVSMEWGTSLATFKDCHRSQKDCLQISGFFFDFDNGLQASKEVNAIMLATGLEYSILASKNHNKTKYKNDGTPVTCERFHLIVPCDNIELKGYKQKANAFLDMFNIKKDDGSVLEYSRFIAQHSAILFCKLGRAINAKEIELPKSKYEDKQYYSLYCHNGVQKTKDGFDCDLFIKTHKELCVELTTDGFRHNAVCVLCGKITQMKKGKNEILQVLQSAGCNLPISEIEYIINSFGII